MLLNCSLNSYSTLLGKTPSHHCQVGIKRESFTYLKLLDDVRPDQSGHFVLFALPQLKLFTNCGISESVVLP